MYLCLTGLLTVRVTTQSLKLYSFNTINTKSTSNYATQSYAVWWFAVLNRTSPLLNILTITHIMQILQDYCQFPPKYKV